MSKTEQHHAMEITRFRLKDCTTKEFVAANKSINEWLRQQPGFISRHMSEDDGAITDIVLWKSVTNGRSAMHRILSETADSPVHAMIDQSTLNWSIAPLLFSIEG